MRRLFQNSPRDETGTTALEYCLIAAGLSIVGVVHGIGANLSTKFASVSSR